MCLLFPSYMEIIEKERRWFVGWTLAFAVLSLVGCGDGRPSRVPVSGRVMIDGQPLKYGHIRFMPEEGRPSSGRLNSEGRFTLSCFEKEDGALLGTHRITVTAGEYVSDTKTIWHAPKKYTDPDASGLTQVISGPTDDLVINLSWDGKQPFVENHEPDPEE